MRFKLIAISSSSLTRLVLKIKNLDVQVLDDIRLIADMIKGRELLAQMVVNVEKRFMNEHSSAINDVVARIFKTYDHFLPQGAVHLHQYSLGILADDLKISLQKRETRTFEEKYKKLYYLLKYMAHEYPPQKGKKQRFSPSDFL